MAQHLHFQHRNLTTADVYSSQLHRLHRVKLFSAAICRVTQGSKVIIQDEDRRVATPAELIILPANVEFEIINQPSQGAFRSELLLLPAPLLKTFKAQHLSSVSPARRASLCAPLSDDLRVMWMNLLHAIRNNLSAPLIEHQACGLLMALHLEGLTGPLLIERHANLTEQVRQMVMSSPARPWTVDDVAQQLSVGASTLRRRLQGESQQFRHIVEEVRMAYALTQLQTTRLPIGDIALRSGYLSSSRFTARFRKHYGCLPKNVR